MVSAVATGARVALRVVVPSDAQAWATLIADNRDFVRPWIDLPSEADDPGARALLQRALDQNAEDRFEKMVIVSPHDDALLERISRMRGGGSRRNLVRWVGAKTQLYRAYYKLSRHRQRAKGQARWRGAFLRCALGILNINEIVRGVFRSAYLGYWIGHQHARQGLMAEALGLALDHAFGPLGLHRLEANIQPENEPSRALVRRAGFVQEGYSERYLKIGGQWRDHERWAITVERWRA